MYKSDVNLKLGNRTVKLIKLSRGNRRECLIVLGTKVLQKVKRHSRRNAYTWEYPQYNKCLKTGDKKLGMGESGNPISEPSC